MEFIFTFSEVPVRSNTKLVANELETKKKFVLFLFIWFGHTKVHFSIFVSGPPSTAVVWSKGGSFVRLSYGKQRTTGQLLIIRGWAVQVQKPTQITYCLHDTFPPAVLEIGWFGEEFTVQMSFSSVNLPGLGEMEQIICSLERGTLIQKFYPRRKPEKKTLMLRRETRQVSECIGCGWKAKHVINSMLPLIYSPCAVKRWCVSLDFVFFFSF